MALIDYRPHPAPPVGLHVHTGLGLVAQIALDGFYPNNHFGGRRFTPAPSFPVLTIASALSEFAAYKMAALDRALLGRTKEL